MRYELVCCPKHEAPLFKAARMKMIDRDRPSIRRLRIKLRATIKAFLKQRGADIAAQVVALRDDLGKTLEDDIRRILEQLDFEDWEKLLAQVEPLLQRMVKDGGAAALVQLGITGDVDRMLSLVNDYAVEYADRAAAELVKNISEATRNMIRADVRDAMEEGASNQELASTLRAGYAFSAERAEMIARTETAYADVQGNIEAYRASGVVSGKEWKTGEGCCDLCDELDGTVVGIGEQFDTDDGAIDGPPLHPNCRCDVLPVLIEDETP